MQRLAGVARWLLPSSGAALVMFALNWFGSRASINDVASSVATASIAAKQAQGDAHHAASIATGHAAELAAIWGHIVAMRAELKVLRAFSKQDGETKSRYIEAAQSFYSLRFEEQLRVHANDPAEAARLALLAQWRPDR